MKRVGRVVKFMTLKRGPIGTFCYHFLCHSPATHLEYYTFLNRPKEDGTERERV